MKKILSSLLAITLAIGLNIAGMPAANAAETPKPQVDNDHKPGPVINGVVLPKNTMVPAGSPYARPGIKPDASGKVPHICAGKKLLYRGHVDAVYATRFNGKLRVTTVDGAKVMPQAEDACIWLAPDAKNNGDEVSRSFVTNDPKMSFLGKPGTIFWLAPYENIEAESKPVWAGFGAFDPNHEKVVPKDIMDDQVTLRLESVAGPGQVDVFTYSSSASGATNMVRHFSSADDGPKETLVNVGTHAHINWAFSKAGVYRLGFTATTVQSGTYLPTTSPKATITWLVGSNEEVGIPAKYSTGADRITRTTEQILKASGVDENAVVDEDKDQSPPKITEEKIKAQAENIWWEKEYYPSNLVAAGVAKVAVSNDLDGNNLRVDLLNHKGETLNGDKSQSSVAIEVPDETLFKPEKTPGTATLFQNHKNGWFWRLAKGNAKGTALVFDTTKTHFENIQDSMMLAVDGSNGVKDGDRLLFVDWSGSGKDLKVNRHFDTNDTDKKFAISKPGEETGDVLFTQPGFYKLSINYKAKLKKALVNQDNPSEPLEYASLDSDITFAVGNEAINLLRKTKYENAKANGESPEAPSYLPINKYPTPKPVDPKPKQGPDLTLEEAKKQVTAAFGDTPRELIEKGHVDMHLVFDAQNKFKKAISGAHWNDGSSEREYPSDTFAFAVPSERWSDKVDAKVVGKRVAEAYPNGLFNLPMVQDANSPWTGFSTEHIPDNRINTAKGIDVKLQNLRGPKGARIIMGAANGINDFDVWLDSARPEEAHNFSKDTHAHMFTFFNKPGLYSADITFTYFTAGLVQEKVVLRTYWAVGDKTIAAIKAHGKPGSDSGDSGSGKKPALSKSLPIDQLVAYYNDESGAAKQLRALEKAKHDKVKPNNGNNNIAPISDPKADDIAEFLAGATEVKFAGGTGGYATPPSGSGRVMGSNVAAVSQDQNKAEATASASASSSATASANPNESGVGGTKPITDDSSPSNSNSSQIINSAAWQWALAGAMGAVFIMALLCGIFLLLRNRK